MTDPEHILTFLWPLRRLRKSNCKKIISDVILRGGVQKMIFCHLDTFWPLEKTNPDNFFPIFFLDLKSWCSEDFKTGFVFFQSPKMMDLSQISQRDPKMIFFTQFLNFFPKIEKFDSRENHNKSRILRSWEKIKYVPESVGNYEAGWLIFFS